MRITCKNCGGPHPVWECRAPEKKSGGAGPKGGSERVRIPTSRPRSTAARKDVRKPPALQRDSVARSGDSVPPVRDKDGGQQVLQALPVDTSSASSPSGKASGFGPDTAGSNPAEATISKRGRKPVENPTPRQLYQRELMRERRAKLKAQKEAGK